MNYDNLLLTVRGILTAWSTDAEKAKALTNFFSSMIIAEREFQDDRLEREREHWKFVLKLHIGPERFKEIYEHVAANDGAAKEAK